MLLVTQTEFLPLLGFLHILRLSKAVFVFALLLVKLIFLLGQVVEDAAQGTRHIETENSDVRRVRRVRRSAYNVEGPVPRRCPDFSARGLVAQ